MIRFLLAACAAAGIALGAAPAAQAAPKVAIFPFELIDVSLSGQYIGKDPREMERLKLITDELRMLAARDGGYEVLDLSGIAPQLEQAAPLNKCGGCEVDLARRAGADLAITGFVRKVSNLVLELHLIVRDVPTGNVTKTSRVELRGNTDETWLRGIRRLVGNLFAG